MLNVGFTFGCHPFLSRTLYDTDPNQVVSFIRKVLDGIRPNLVNGTMVIILVDNPATVEHPAEYVYVLDNDQWILSSSKVSEEWPDGVYAQF